MATSHLKCEARYRLPTWKLKDENTEAEGCMKLPTLTTAATARMNMMA